MKKLAVVVPTHNRRDELKQLLISLANQKIDFDLKVLPVVIIDGSTDGTREMLKKNFPDTQIIDGNGQWWYTRSMNEGFVWVLDRDFDFVLTMNDDCILREGYLNSLFKDFNELPNKENSILGSISFSVEQPTKLMFAGIKKIIWWRYKVRYYASKNKIANPDNYSGVYKSCSLPGRGIFMPVNILEKLNCFNSKFPQYGSDSDFIFRAREKGMEVYISWNAKLFTYLAKTGKGSVYNKESFLEFSKNFFNPYARNNLVVIIRLVWNHGYKVLAPITILIKILGHYKNFILSR